MLLTYLTIARFLQGIQRTGSAVESVLRSEATKENEVFRLKHLKILSVYCLVLFYACPKVPNA